MGRPYLSHRRSSKDRDVNIRQNELNLRRPMVCVTRRLGWVIRGSHNRHANGVSVPMLIPLRLDGQQKAFQKMIVRGVDQQDETHGFTTHATEVLGPWMVVKRILSTNHVKNMRQVVSNRSRR